MNIVKSTGMHFQYGVSFLDAKCGEEGFILGPGQDSEMEMEASLCLINWRHFT